MAVKTKSTDEGLHKKKGNDKEPSTVQMKKAQSVQQDGKPSKAKDAMPKNKSVPDGKKDDTIK